MAFPGTFNISYYKGDTYEFLVYPKDSSGGTFNLNDYQTARLTISEKRGTAGVSTAINGVASISGTKDYVKCTITPANGLLMDPAKTYVYDVQVGYTASPYDYVYTLLTGAITLTDHVTVTGAGALAPSSPTAFISTTVTSTSATVTWALPATIDPVVGYKLAKTTTPLDLGSYTPIVATLADNVFTYTFTELSPSTTYGLSVQAYNDGGSSTPATITITTGA